MSASDFHDAARQAKLNALAEFAAGAGHEINNPLATILGRTDLLARRIARVTPSGEATEAIRDLQIIAGQVQRIRDMIGDLMLFARPPVPRLERCDLSAAARQGAANLAPQARSAAIEIVTDLAEAVSVEADPTQLAVVLSELLRNAINALEPGGTVTIKTQTNRNFGILSVTDNGTGLSEVDREHLFDPFYSGRQAGRGLGFGLCKCWRILQQHGGSIDVSSRQPLGVIATTRWPTRQAGNRDQHSL